MEVNSRNRNNLIKLNEDYRMDAIHTGSIERMDYITYTYDNKNIELKKSLNVYLPQGYNSTDQRVRYNIFYLMHGGGENENTLFEGPGKSTELKNIIDYMNDKQEIDPMIIVTPTFYVNDNQDVSFLSRNFHKELMNDILPAVESKYNTYAEGITLEDFKRSREHRAFGGFSMGAACTWYIFLNCLDYFKYYMPLSGDCWAIEDRGGLTKPKETAELLVNAVNQLKYKKEDYYIFCATGSKDIAYDNMIPQVEEMIKLRDYFVYSSDGYNGNLAFYIKPDATHWWHYVYEYVYIGLLMFFKE